MRQKANLGVFGMGKKYLITHNLRGVGARSLSERKGRNPEGRTYDLCQVSAVCDVFKTQFLRNG